MAGRLSGLWRSWSSCWVECEAGAAVGSLFASDGFDRVIHLAAQASVRYSFLNPNAYATATSSAS